LSYGPKVGRLIYHGFRVGWQLHHLFLLPEFLVVGAVYRPLLHHYTTTPHPSCRTNNPLADFLGGPVSISPVS